MIFFLIWEEIEEYRCLNGPVIYSLAMPKYFFSAHHVVPATPLDRDSVLNIIINSPTVWILTFCLYYIGGGKRRISVEIIPNTMLKS
jgi:hypothetical protein